jgi:hypothetical protein
MNAIVPREEVGALLERVIVQGDLSKLSPIERVSYYKQVCESAGLNPLTKPLEFITLNGKLVLYALRGATDQLRKVHGISVEIKAREMVEDVYVVTAQAKMGDRMDESIGAVPLGQLKGEARANGMMKAETKAKRRVTLSICGLGMLDETEVASIPQATDTYVDKDTGEIRPKITPSAGVRDSLTEPQRVKIEGSVEYMRDAIMKEDYVAAVVESEKYSDPEELIYLMTFFDAPSRKRMKAVAKARQVAASVPQGDAELPAIPF